MRKTNIIIIFLALLFPSFSLKAQEKIIIVNEGLWQTDNGRLSYFEDGRVVSNQWFRDMNHMKLGDTPSDIIQVNDNLIAIALNWSNIVQFITPEGKAVAAIEDIPNNRKLATDGRYVYVTSYGHECLTSSGYRYFTKGFVAKIDVATFKVVDAVEVGYEPEGIAIYDGYLFVANTGGYAFQESHDYETTVSVLRADNLKTVRTVDTGQINLYGKMSKCGRYLCINSPGDYYEVSGATLIFDCKAAIEGSTDERCYVKLPVASTYNCKSADETFYAVGSRYSYLTGDYTTNYSVIDPEEVFATGGFGGVSERWPGNMASDLRAIAMPYAIYVNPYTGYIYATDAGSYTGAGQLYQWNPDGELLGTNTLYITPAHFLALPPDGVFSAIEDIPNEMAPEENGCVFDLLGRPVVKPRKGHFYIRNGKKFIMK